MDLGFKLYFEDRTVFVPASQMKSKAEGNVTVYETKIGSVDVLWTHTRHEGGILVDLSVSSPAPLRIRRIDSVILDAGVPGVADHITLLGRESRENEIRFPYELGEDVEYGETAVGLYPSMDAEGILLAGVAPFKNICKAVALKDGDGRFTFSVKTEYTKGMLDYRELKAERVYLNRKITIDELFTVYRDLLPESHFPMPKLTGWNTWDYYLDKVTETDIFENAAALRKMPFADILDYIVIDDGWQKGWGDWTENEKFSGGLKAVADGIRKEGFLPGIWMAPVAVQETVSLFREHEDWLCKNEEGGLLQSMGFYYLDPTHPEARKFILDNYRYQYEAGFRLFKMDYVSPLLEVKSFYDKDANPYGVIAGLIEDVKACTGPDAVVLGCSVPLECGADIAPSMRIALDIHNHFSHVEAITRSIAWAFLYNNKVTRIDPDFLLVRGEETSSEPLTWVDNKRNDYVAPPRCKQTREDRMKMIWRHGDQFSAIEAETWANLVAISGGNIFLSDRMSVLNDRGIGIIDRALRLAGEEVRPVYLHDDHRIPSLWKGDKGILVVNWEDCPRTITVRGVAQVLTSEKPFDQTGETVSVTLLPHESFAALYS